jgi:hypothetical protein
MQCRAVILGLGCLLIVAGTSAAAAEPSAATALLEARLTVRLASGRSFSGQIDSQSDGAHLRLRFAEGSAAIVRPIQWDRVVEARLADKPLAGSELRDLVRSAGLPLAPTPVVAVSRPGRGSFIAPALPEPSDVPPVAAPRVRSITVNAGLANWDADVEPDGLVVYVQPLDDQGRLVPVDGTLDVELVAETVDRMTQARPFGRLAYWSRSVSAAEFTSSGAGIPLEFQAVHPEFVRNVASHGALRVRLSVPGQGTFEATESPVRIRSASVWRDRLEQMTGRRYLPQEQTGDGRK